MSIKDVPDLMVCRAFALAHGVWEKFPCELLAEWTGQPEKVCYRAIERSVNRGLVDYGTSLRTGWVTAAGKKLLNDDGKGAMKWGR